MKFASKELESYGKMCLKNEFGYRMSVKPMLSNQQGKVYHSQSGHVKDHSNISEQALIGTKMIPETDIFRISFMSTVQTTWARSNEGKF